jgi:RND family efflux transporter MFP subunit
LILAACFSALLPLACSHKNDAASQSAEPVSVTVTVARIDTLTDRLTASGTVAPAPAADWVIYAPESAQIVELPKKEGDTVVTGDLLVRFDVATVTQDVANGELAVAQATARIDTAKAELAKLSALSDRGLVARNALDAARTELIDAQTALTRATADLAGARSRQAQTEVRARFPGVVTKRWHGEGDVVIAAETDPVLRVIDATRLQVVVPLSMADLTRILPGQAATVAAPGAPGEAATVVVRPTEPDSTGRTAEVRLAFAAPTTLTLDAVVDVAIVIDQHENVLVVPRVAVLRDDEASFVLVAGSDNVAHRKVVQVGFATRDQIEILTGIAAGDRVITSGFDQIGDGSAIVIER